MDLRLKGKVAVVTGGSLGIGRAVAQALAEEGVQVALISRGREALERAAAEIAQATGVKTLAVPVDVSDTAGVQAAMGTIAAHFGRLDILVNGAAHPGGLVRSALEEADPEGLLRDIDIKVVGYMRCAKAAVPFMKQGGYGRIINIGGLTGRGSKQLSGLRNVAIVHLTKTLSDQLGPHGITVNVIHPGVVDTPHIHELYAREAKLQGLTPAEVEANYCKVTPIRRTLQPAEIADAVLFLASERAAAITGESLGVDGGITRGITVNVIHPGVVDTPHIHELYAREAKLQGLTPAEVEANYCKVTPIRRTLQPAEIADAVLFLASERAAAITGESLGVDGGITRGIFM